MWDTHNPCTAVHSPQQCFLGSPAEAWGASQQRWSWKEEREGHWIPTGHHCWKTVVSVSLPPNPFPPQSYLLAFIIHMVPAMIFFWTAMRCSSSLAKRQSSQSFAMLLEVACRRRLWVLGAVQSREPGTEAEKSSRAGRAAVGPPSMATGYQSYPTVLGCSWVLQSQNVQCSSCPPAISQVWAAKHLLGKTFFPRGYLD